MPRKLQDRLLHINKCLLDQANMATWLYLVFYHHVCLKALLHVNPLYSGNPKMSTLANSEDPHEMQHYDTFHQGLHC